MMTKSHSKAYYIYIYIVRECAIYFILKYLNELEFSKYNVKIKLNITKIVKKKLPKQEDSYLIHNI